ncbi:MAG: reverse transcriptase [Betaproteobacteria bacterium]|nr:reverse transcriptase [Betaproteobacteria bacterium]
MSASKIFKRVFTKKYLTTIFVNHIRNSGAVGLDRVRPANFEKIFPKEVSSLNKKIQNGSYRFTRYKQKLISKGAGKYPRVISIPTVRDRVVLRGICDFLTDTFDHVTLEIPQVKIAHLKNALESGQYSEYIKIDLANFYPSIDHELLAKTLRKKIRKSEALALVQNAIRTETVAEGPRRSVGGKNSEGVPQGLSISNILAEIFIADFDRHMASQNEIFYQRYVDDILILCKLGCAEAIAGDAIDFLKKKKLHPHELNASGASKSSRGTISSEFDYLGYKVFGGKLAIRSPSIQKFESSIAKIFTTYRYQLQRATNDEAKQRTRDVCEWRLNLRITGCIFNGKRLGWVFYFSQITDTTPLRMVDSTIAAFQKRFKLDGKIKVKRTLKAFYEASRTDKATHHYIVNFDGMNIQEKREVLEKYLGMHQLANASDDDIERYFKMRISAVVKELEEDLVGIS